MENKKPARRADLWMEFVNSNRHDYLGTGQRLDSLDEPKWLDDFLKRWDLGKRPVRRGRLLPALRKLRLILQKKAEAITRGQPVKDLGLRDLNAYLAKSPLIRRLEIGPGRARVRLEPVRRSETSILAEIVSSFADALAGGEVSRLKACGNRDCRWIFSDGSKSQTRRWCGPTCGNLMKVRRYRRRMVSCSKSDT
ncbi:MAG: CGNR zinc finger domain-containing protein [Candidatus Aminicenantales bacterium]